MDVRAKIVDKVLENLPELDPELRDKVERVLLVSLQDYEVQERCTDVVVHDDSSLGLVRKFIATKKLEGKSERTLRRYQPELENWSYSSTRSFTMSAPMISACISRCIRTGGRSVTVPSKT